MMRSYELAVELKAAAEFLLSRPDFEVARAKPWVYIGHYWSNKAGFLEAVRALGSVRKEWIRDELKITTGPNHIIEFSISRSAVCRKVQDEKWECEPLLTPDEEAQIG